MAKQTDGDTKFQKVVRHFLTTPPRPRTQEPADVLRPGDCFLVIGHAMRIAGNQHANEDGSITADLYLNLDDYRAGRVMEPEFTYRR